MQKLWNVAPPGTWAILGLAAILLLAAFVLLSHTLLRRKAHGDSYDGITAHGRLEWTLRVGFACLLGGVALWAVELNAPLSVVLALAAGAVVAAALEVTARVRGSGKRAG